MTIGDRIRRIRKKRRLTQAELAMMSGLSLSAIQGYEQGRYEPKRKSLESIAEVFKIPVDELYDMPAQLGTNLAEVGTDCISRQAAIDATKKHYRAHDNDLLELIAFDIEQLPPIQPEPHWIPVEQDLPEEETDVLVTVHFLGLNQTHRNGWNDHIKESYYVEVASHINGEWSSASDEYKIARDRHKVVAWRELPEPFKGVTE